MSPDTPFQIKVAVASHSQIGEGAIWDERDNRLWWVDITAGLIHVYDPARDTNTTYEFGEMVGSISLREAGGLVVAARSGFWFFDPETGARQHIHDPEPDRPDNRFNDGATDYQGRFWAGTMRHDPPAAPTGRWYRLDPDLSVTPWLGDKFTPNGMVFSADGKTMFHSDSNPAVRSIWTSDYDTQTGTPGAPKLLFDTNAVAGRPDGATIDSEGCYWFAGVSGWQIYRLTPQGAVDRVIDMPVERPSKPMFGGPNLDILYVTSIGIGLTPGTEGQQPGAGHLFALHGLGVTGIKQPRFAG